MKSEKKIAAIIPYTVFPARMGGQKGIALFYEYLLKYTELTLFCTSETVAPPLFGHSIIPILGNSFLRYVNPRLYFSLKKYIRKNGISHLLIEHPYFGWLGILLKKSTGIKLIVHSHNIESLRFKTTGRWWWFLLKIYERWVHKCADFNFFITDEDRQFAVSQFKLSSETCTTITYGTSKSKAPESGEKREARSFLEHQHGIKSDEKILLFNGTLHYGPNLTAVDTLLHSINPVLMQQDGFKYKIVICGKGLPESYHQLTAYKNSNIIFAGFVNDITPYFLGADLFINPVIEGGGIKTKLVEALGFNINCISTESGAMGIPTAVTGNKLVKITDNNWTAFTDAIIKDEQAEIPSVFFDFFYWENIAKKAFFSLP